MPMDIDSWVKDGTPATPPVTETTPDITPTGEGGDQSATSVVQPSDPPATPTEAAEAEKAELKAEIEMIEAQLDGKPYKIPKSAKVPLQHGQDVEWVTIEEARLRGMKEKDYRIKTAAAAEERRALQSEKQQFAAYMARVRAREAHVREQEERIRQAQLDPEKWSQFERHLEMLKNPEYRKLHEDALAKRETEAELLSYRQQQEASAVQDSTQAVLAAIEQYAEEFPGVDKERVRVAYGDALIQGRLPLSEAALRSVFEQEAQHVNVVKETFVGPLQKELAEMRAELAELRKARAAEEHNTSTKEKIAKSKAPGAPVGGAPPAPKGKSAAVIPGERLEDRARRWGKGEL